MQDLADQRERARALIREACELLRRVRAGQWPWALDWDAVQPDLMVLLDDAVQLYCRAVGSGGSLTDHRARPGEWAQRLQAYPEQCDQILERLVAVVPDKSEPVGQRA